MRSFGAIRTGPDLFFVASRGLTSSPSMDPPVGRGHVAGCHAAPLTWEGLLRFLLLSGDLGKPGEVALGRPYRASILLPWVPGQKANRVLKGAT